METTVKTKTGYILVTELQKGDTVINLGIIENIFPHVDINETWIKFSPARAQKETIKKYKNSDKLKIA